MPAPTAALARLLTYYNGDPFSVANPGGLDADGHRTNFVPILRDVADIAIFAGASAEEMDEALQTILTNLALSNSAKTAAQAAATAAQTWNPANYYNITTINGLLAVKASEASLDAVAATIPTGASTAQAQAGTEPGLFFMSPKDVADAILAQALSYAAGISAKTANYTIVASDKNETIDCTANTFTLSTVATAATLGNGFVFHVRNRGGGIVTFNPAGSETIDGRASIAIYQEDVTIVCDGTNWSTRNRQRGWITAVFDTIMSAANEIDVTSALLLDLEIQDIEITGFKVPTSSSQAVVCRVAKGGALITSSTYKYSRFSQSGNDGSNGAAYIEFLTGVSSIQFEAMLKNFKLSDPLQQVIEIWARDYNDFTKASTVIGHESTTGSITAFQISGISAPFNPGGSYRQRVYRP